MIQFLSNVKKVFKCHKPLYHVILVLVVTHLCLSEFIFYFSSVGIVKFAQLVNLLILLTIDRLYYVFCKILAALNTAVSNSRVMNYLYF